MKSTEEFWDSMATSYDDAGAVGRFVDGLDAAASSLVENLRVDKSSYLLDLCCGNGLLTNIMAGKCASVVGLDISAEMLKRAEILSQKYEVSNIKYIQGVAAVLPFEDDTFDATFCMSSFQLFSSYSMAELVLKELVRVTKPTGRVVVGEIPWKGTLGYMIWNLIRVRGYVESDGYVPLLDLPLYKKILERFKLVSRRFSGRRVASDDWLWYDDVFFKSLLSDSKFNNVRIKLSPKKIPIKYQFDVVLST